MKTRTRQRSTKHVKRVRARSPRGWSRLSAQDRELVEQLVQDILNAPPLRPVNPNASAK